MRDSKSQLSALTLLAGVFDRASQHFSDENSRPVRNHSALAAGKLLKKPDQCRGITLTAHLYATTNPTTQQVMFSISKLLRLLNVKHIISIILIFDTCRERGTNTLCYKSAFEYTKMFIAVFTVAYSICKRTYPQVEDADKVLECLKKGVRIATQCMDPAVQTQLFVELLDHYVYFYEKGIETVSTVLKKAILSSQ